MAKYFMAREKKTPNFKLTIIDRWSMNSGLVSAFKQLIEAEIAKFPADKQNEVLLLFTAHSIPLRVNIITAFIITLYRFMSKKETFLPSNLSSLPVWVEETMAHLKEPSSLFLFPCRHSRYSA